MHRIHVVLNSGHRFLLSTLELHLMSTFCFITLIIIPFLVLNDWMELKISIFKNPKKENLSLSSAKTSDSQFVLLLH